MYRMFIVSMSCQMLLTWLNTDSADFLTSVSSEAPGLTYLLPGLLSLILYLLAFAILQTRS